MSDLTKVDRRSRLPLAVGREYLFPGYDTGFQVIAMSLPGHPSDDGGLPGVAVRWLLNGRVNPNIDQGWYPVRTEAEFWAHRLFCDAYDPPEAP